MVLVKDALNLALPSIVIKFLIPANSIGLLPSHFINARTKAKIMGPSVKTANPMKLGTMKEYATISLFS